MKKIIYLAPLALLGIGAKVSANQVSTHISNALKVYEQESNQNQPVVQSESEQANYQAKPSLPNGQNQPIGKVEGATHISRLDGSLLNKDSSVENRQDSQVMKISRSAIPTKQELNESKESVAGQYVQVQQNKVAQFNKGSKIYGLNNSNQLSKNNGDGYVITNAGMYNGRPVDIAVTINNVQDDQGSYTTKWSNGDKADVTGKVDNDFNYQNGVLIGNKSITPQVDQTKTRPRIENQTKVIKTPGYVYQVAWSTHNYYIHEFISPQLMYEIKQKYNLDDKGALRKLYADSDANIRKVDVEDVNADGSIKLSARYKIQAGLEDNDGKPKIGDFDRAVMQLSDDTKDSMGHVDDQSEYSIVQDIYVIRCTVHKDKMPTHDGVKAYCPIGVGNNDLASITVEDHLDSRYSDGYAPRGGDPDNPAMSYGYSFYHNSVSDMSKEEIECTKPLLSDYTWTETEPTKVIDHLVIDRVKNGNLSYNYKVGVYDAKTGKLIKDLTAEYKGKAGKAATDQDTAMNNAVKAKIQAINANTANATYTGTAASDDIAFNKNTVHVNYIDTRGESINVPGYDIDVDNLTSGNYQVPQNYILANTNGFKVTKNTHEVNGVTVTDSYNFIDQGNNKVTNNGKTLSVVLKHRTRPVDPNRTGLSNDVTNNVFVINNGAKRQINSQSRHFGAAGVLDLVTNKVTKQGDWQLLGKSNFDRTNINNDLIGYGNAIHNNLTFLAL